MDVERLVKVLIELMATANNMTLEVTKLAFETTMRMYENQQRMLEVIYHVIHEAVKVKPEGGEKR